MTDLFFRIRNALRSLKYPHPWGGERVGSEFTEIYKQTKAFTMTTWQRMYATYLATRYVAEAGIPGDLVECGVWRGGSAMIMARTLLPMGVNGRTLHLFDTFEGMTEPSPVDLDHEGLSAAKFTQALLPMHNTERGVFAVDLDEVEKNLESTGFPSAQMQFVKGRVEDTIPRSAPHQISLLRLDTDWYESTRHELEQLFPRVASGGVIIIDDYGHWQGARRAADEYFKTAGIPVLLNRIDYSGRLVIKVHDGRLTAP